MNNKPSFQIEKEYFQKGKKFIVGVDEAGRGAWAGPVVAGAVILGKRRFQKINDSKLLSPQKREKLYEKIIREAIDWAVGIAEIEEIDSLGVGKASTLAMFRAILQLKRKPQVILTDAFKIVGIKNVPVVPIKFGDRKSITIAAASIVAKVERDRIMKTLHLKHPEYQFEKHKGYGTALHKSLMEKYGICSLHRKSFLPVKKFI